MAWYWIVLISAVTTVTLAALFVAGAFAWERAFGAEARKRSTVYVSKLLGKHFHPHAVTTLVVTERNFPYRARADLHQTVDRLLARSFEVSFFSGLYRENDHEGITFAQCFAESAYSNVTAAAPQYEEVDVGQNEAVRCLKSGIWLAQKNGHRHAVILCPLMRFSERPGICIQIASTNEPTANHDAREFFRELEESVAQSQTYRGKILSLEQNGYGYSGQSTGIKVHRLRTVERDQVILPAKTLDLLERNVVQFVHRRVELARFQQPTKKGLLFYGPPGTGKTHTIHFLARELPGHTTLLITSEQVALLDEYMTLARLLQPSLVVIEDADLIARDRAEMGVCEEVLLNKLLNDMDGLREEANILFILTTNRPEMLEPALASRPGRIDQAIEFPLPDDVGRRKLVRLYSQGIAVSDEVVDEIVRRTDRVSAAFIKELMRRSVQFHLERNGTGALAQADVESALDEMLFDGGALNLKLLGAEAAQQGGATGFR